MSCRETQYQHVSRADSPLFPYQEMRLLPDSDDPRRSVNRRRDFSNGSAANEKHAATLNSTFVSRLIKDLHGKRKIARVCLFDCCQNETFYTNCGVFNQHGTAGSVLLFLVISKSTPPPPHPDTSRCSSLLLFRWR